MATFTITTPVNIDSLASKVGSDIYNINGGYLTIDQHTRYGTNQNTSAALGNITLSATLGGSIEFNSNGVRLIPFESGTGNVPAFDTIISQNTASAILMGVYGSLTTAPRTVGSAMPASGYILVRQWNNVSYGSGVLTGIGAVASSPDGPGWLDIVGVDALTVTVSRLNTFKVRGNYFYFLNATTTGNNATTYQIPSNGATVYCPGIEVETGVNTGVYEFYPNAGSKTALAANIATDKIRGKWCWINTSGAVTFANDGTNATGGYIPPAGLRIRVANIFFNCCTAAALTNNVLPNVTLATRYEFLTTGGGNIDIDTASMNWYLNLNQPFSVNLKNISTFSNITITECASTFSLNNVNVGQEAANSQFALILNYNFAGGTITNSTWTRSAQAASGNFVVSMSYCNNITTINDRIFSLTKAANAAAGSITITGVVSSSWQNCLYGGGKVSQSGCTNTTFTGSGYFDNIAVTTTATIPMYAFEISNYTSNCTIDGLTFNDLLLVQPYSGIVNILAPNCSNIKIRNMGTYATPLDLGSVRFDKISWSRTTTVATVTKTNHGLKVGDRFYVPVSSSIAAVPVGTKTVASVTSSDVFTFACINAGAASGTISYYPTMSGTFVAIAASAAANNVKIQRCYVTHTATNLFSIDNSSKNIVLENVLGDYLSPFLTPALNLTMRGVSGVPPLTAQVACYGTHWLDVIAADIATNLSNQVWNRTTTTCTVTSLDHKLRTGLFINVNTSSDTAAIPLGTKVITVLDADTFTFTCLNAGTSGGTLSYTATNDKICIVMNEATADTATQYTDIVGRATFTSAGTLVMPAINDSITFVSPEYFLNYTSFPIQEVVMAGGTIGNYNIKYAINTGSGYSSWRNLYYNRSGASGVAGQPTFTVTDSTEIEIGDYVWGTGIAGNAVVTDIVGNVITVDQNNISTVSGIVRFNHLHSEILPSSGFKLKIKITTIIANVTGISALSIFADTTESSRAVQYPLDRVNATLSLYGMETGSEVRVYRTADDVQLAGEENILGSDFTYDYIWTGTDIDVYIVVFSLTSQPIRFTNQILGASGLTIPVLPVIDRQYANTV